MRAVGGAIAVLMLELAIYLCPPDRDPVFAQLSNAQQAFFIAGLAILIWAAVFLFAIAAVGMEKKAGSDASSIKAAE